MNQPVEVEVLGQRLLVRSDSGEEHVREVAASVNRQAKKLADEYPHASVLQLALLTALNIASECSKLSFERADVDAALERLVECVDARVAG